MASHPPPSFHTSPPSHCRHPTQNSRHRNKARRVRFAASTVDVLDALAHRRSSRLLHHSTLNSPPTFRPILKDSEGRMIEYLKKTWEDFSKELHAFGRWCQGV